MTGALGEAGSPDGQTTEGRSRLIPALFYAPGAGAISEKPLEAATRLPLDTPFCTCSENGLFWNKLCYNCIVQIIDPTKYRGKGRPRLTDYVQVDDSELEQIDQNSARCVHEWVKEPHGTYFLRDDKTGKYYPDPATSFKCRKCGALRSEEAV